ncbi:MAG TPA: ice-binding family protein, partial [Nocardioides sp.]|nr:ice-binding family protein [Nocardioides sp.]
MTRAHSQHRRGGRSRRAIAAVCALAVALLAVGVASGASAYWTATVAVGGHGTAAAGTVDPGATPVATVDSSAITVTWPATELSSGAPADGYTVIRYALGSPMPQPVGGSCAGLVATSPCTETAVPRGDWVYTVTPRVGAHWRGQESPRSATVTIGPAAPPLATAATFSVLGGTGVTSTGFTTVSGDLGTSPSPAVVGFPDGVVAGSIHAGDATAAQAQADLTAAYNNADTRTPDTEFAGDLNGRTFFAGVHHSA